VRGHRRDYGDANGDGEPGAQARAGAHSAKGKATTSVDRSALDHQ
jgi:hypothetical protein